MLIKIIPVIKLLSQRNIAFVVKQRKDSNVYHITRLRALDEPWKKTLFAP